MKFIAIIVLAWAHLLVAAPTSGDVNIHGGKFDVVSIYINEDSIPKNKKLARYDTSFGETDSETDKEIVFQPNITLQEPTFKESEVNFGIVNKMLKKRQPEVADGTLEIAESNRDQKFEEN